MKYFSVLLLLVGSLFLGCGDGTEIKTKSTNIRATTADGETYTFSGSIILEWDSYKLDDDDEIKIYNVKVITNKVEYPTTWSWSSKLEDLKSSDVNDKETTAPINFVLKLPKSTVERSCELKYNYSLDGDIHTNTINCKLPSGN